MYLSKTIGITPNGFFYLILALASLFVCALNNLFVKPVKFISSILLFYIKRSFFGALQCYKTRAVFRYMTHILSIH